MTTPEIKNILSYWRNSLADAPRVGLDPGKITQVKIPREEVAEGYVNLKSTTSLFQQMETILDIEDDPEREKKLKDLQVLICPVRAHLKPIHGESPDRLDEIVIPQWIPATLDRNGKLAPHSERIPWISRDLLDPISAGVIVGTVDDLDSFLAENPVPTGQVQWADWWAFSRKMFEQVVKCLPDQFHLPEYETLTDAFVFIDSENLIISHHVIEAYDRLPNDQLPQLLNNYANLKEPSLLLLLSEIEQIKALTRHLGQMGTQPLMASQREALAHILKIAEGDILAVNGPPGNGKTTLLQSVVASLWVDAALDGKDPPLILASSTNNQAVTNIIDSFGNVEKTSSLLSGRWVDGVKSYGLYCASASRTQSEDSGIQTIYLEMTKRQGFYNIEKDIGYIKKASESFLKKCSDKAGKDVQSLDEAISYLLGELKKVVETIRQGMATWQDVLECQTQVMQKYGSEQDLLNFIAKQERASLSREQEIRRLKEIRHGWIRHVLKDSWWMRWCLESLGFLPLLKHQVRLRNRDYFLGCDCKIDVDLSDDKKVEDHFDEIISSKEKEHRDLLKPLLTAQKVLNCLKEARMIWDIWRKSRNGDEDLQIWLDRGPRLEAFQCATHYWEAHWLKEVTVLMESGRETTRSRESQERKWRRYAKLTPCFVSTCYMAPKFWTAYNGKEFPLLEYIDLLIIDEAGQVLPEVAGPTFALARKALVVGDSQQLEPVWNIHPKVDIGNLMKHKVIEHEKDADTIHDKGMSASRGCVMKIAQRQSRYQKYEDIRGMYLTEHWRCRPKIVRFLNQLTYKGRLKCMRNDPPENFPLPEMGYAHVPGSTQRDRSGSRWNENESEVIAQWIMDNRKLLEKEYKKDIEKIVGIITPFSRQSRQIRKALKSRQIDQIKVGTVHKLQGAERPVIIFSPVYSKKEGTFFFDRGKNMLTVVVSRAQDSFLVFGNMHIFDRRKQSLPSGLLAHYLFDDQSNELTDIHFPERHAERSVPIKRLSKLDEHIEALSECFHLAQNRVFVVSPYISAEAILADTLPEKVARAVQRGVKVTFVIDQDSNNDQAGKERQLSVQGKRLLIQSGAALLVAQNIHNKILCIDDSVIIEGSFNWLSAVRADGSRFCRSNSSLRYEGSGVKQMVANAINEIEEKVVSR